MVKVITEMPQASVTEDGDRIELVFKDKDGGEEALQFSSDDFERFISRAVQLVTHAQNQKLSIGDHRAIHRVPVVAAMVDATVGGGKVTLSLRANNGLLYHFALSPDDADGLRPQIFRAVNSARKQASQSRH